jgi:hypothetical protein
MGFKVQNLKFKQDSVENGFLITASFRTQLKLGVNDIGSAPGAKIGS